MGGWRGFREGSQLVCSALSNSFQPQDAVEGGQDGPDQDPTHKTVSRVRIKRVDLCMISTIMQDHTCKLVLNSYRASELLGTQCYSELTLLTRKPD